MYTVNALAGSFIFIEPLLTRMELSTINNDILLNIYNYTVKNQRWCKSSAKIKIDHLTLGSKNWACVETKSFNLVFKQFFLLVQ